MVAQIQISTTVQAVVVTNTAVGGLSVTVEADNTGTVVVSEVGVQGIPGQGTSPYQHMQLSAATPWVVNHNLGRKPTAVAVLSPGFIELGAEVQHISDNQLEIRFASPQAGLARVL